jgi:hypothetical protein
VNRHGISQNPTAEESALLWKLWAGDAAKQRVISLQRENERLHCTPDAADLAHWLQETIESHPAIQVRPGAQPIAYRAWAEELLARLAQPKEKT